MKYSVQKQFLQMKVTVSFDKNGGDSVTSEKETYVLGQTYGSLPTATKSGLLFSGWYTDSTSGTKVTKDSQVLYSAKTLYAHYKEFTNYTSFNVTTTSSYKEFGFYSLTKKSSSESVFVDWGDGTVEELTSYSQVYHTYSSVGDFVVKVSDDITQFCISNSSSTYYNKVRYTLKNIGTVSTSVTSLPVRCFNYCSALTSLSWLYSTAITSLPNYCFYYCQAITSLDGCQNITSLGTYCFAYCTKLTSLNGCQNVTSIGNWCFHKCSGLTSFAGIGNITSLTNGSFHSCSGIKSLSTLPISVTSYYSQCLSYTGISDLSRIRSSDTLNSGCFSYMQSLTSLTTLIPRSSLPDDCFLYCTGLKNADLTQWTNLKSIPSNCFQYTNYMTSFTAPSSLTSIGSYAFQYAGNNTKLSADFSSTSLTSINSYAFYYCRNLSQIKLPSTLKYIGSYAFYYNYNYLTSICLPSALTSIGSYAFSYCYNLQQISCLAENAPTVQSTTFGNSTYDYTGRSTYSAGTNRLYVNNPNNYKTSYWSSVLLDSSKCGFTVQSLDEHNLEYGTMSGLSSWYLSTGSEIVPDISVYSSNGTLLTEDTDYKKVLSNNVNVGTAGISAVGISPYYGFIGSTFKILAKEPSMTKLEYIETLNSCAQYIDTGIVLQANDKVECEYQLLNSATGGGNTGYIGVYGARKTNYNYNCHALFSRFGASNCFCYCRTGNEQSSSINSTSCKYKIVAQNSTATFYDSSGTQVGTINSSGTIDNCYNNCLIFGLNTSSTTTSQLDTWPGQARMYNFSITRDSEKIIDLIPVKDSDGIACMYDKVSETFFYNQGTGDFVAGPELAYTELEYIQGNGGILDTGYTPSLQTSINFKCNFENYSGDVYVGHGGSETTQADNNDFRFFYNNEKFCFWDCGSARYQRNFSLTESNFYEVSCWNGGYKVGSSSQSTSTSTNSVTGATIKIFGFKAADTGVDIKFSWLKILENGSLAMDIIPVKKSDGTVCFYDKIGDTYLYGANSNQFTAGPEK